MSDYFAYNGPMVTTAPAVAVTTGTATKTMMQVVAGPNDPLRVWKWGVILDPGTTTGTVKAELIHTGTVAATVTGYTAGLTGVQPYGPDQVTSATIQGSTTGSGYTATAEGTITASRYGDLQWLTSGTYSQNEWSLDREFYVPAAGVLRVRLTATVTTNALVWAIWSE